MLLPCLLDSAHSPQSLYRAFAPSSAPCSLCKRHPALRDTCECCVQAQFLNSDPLNTWHPGWWHHKAQSVSPPRPILLLIQPWRASICRHFVL